MRRILPFFFIFLSLWAGNWPEKPWLSDGKVIPQNGTTRTSYYAEISYFHPEEISPVAIRVFIDGNPYELSLKRGKSWKGIYRSAPITLPPGEHSFYFLCEDEKGQIDRFPRYGEKKGPFVGLRTKYNRKPVLSEGGVYFDYGDEKDIYTFTVKYYDPDCNPPRSVIAVVNAVECTMSLHKGKPSNGIYLVKRKMRSFPNAYYFYAEDFNGARISLPGVGFIRGPKVEKAENEDPILADWRVEPNLGGPETEYTFYLRYKDPDFDPPSIIQVVINDTPYQMKFHRGKKCDGIYIFRTRLLESLDNRYYFYAEDGRGGLRRVPERGAFHGPVVIR
ncbi:MAG: hypothetical protein ABIK97_07750 [candidate division WOR-3 bacterium]